MKAVQAEAENARIRNHVRWLGYTWILYGVFAALTLALWPKDLLSLVCGALLLLGYTVGFARGLVVLLQQEP